MADRSVSPTPRKEDIRDKNNVVSVAIQFDLNQIRAHFYSSIDDINKQFVVADNLLSDGKEEEAMNIWRSQIVFIESIMDFFIHEISKYAIVKMFKGEWETSNNYSNFMIPMSTVEEALKNPESTEWLFSRLNTRFSNEVYLSNEKLGQQLSLIGMNFDDVCKVAFPKIKDIPYVKGQQRLDGLFKRRNQIAHQADRKHEDAEKEPINKKTVEDAMIIVKSFVDAIYACATDKEL